MKLRYWPGCALLVVGLAFAGVLTAAAIAQATAAPQNTGLPTISGTARQGQTLTATNGSWSNNPTSFSYQWQRCNANGSGCADISGATKQSYTLTSADVDHRVRVVVTASNADGQSSASSRTSAIVSSSGAPVNTAKPTIAGTALPGQELTANPGTWTGGVRSFAYQWQRCAADGTACANITGATGRTYGVRIADTGHRLRVVVTATNASGSSASAASAPTLVVGNATTTTVVTTTVAGNKAPTISFVSLKRVGLRIYARFRVCDDRAGRITIIERDVKARRLSYTRRFAVYACGTYTRHWTLIARFRGRGRFVVTLRARDNVGALSRLVSRSLVFR